MSLERTHDGNNADTLTTPSRAREARTASPDHGRAMGAAGILTALAAYFCAMGVTQSFVALRASGLHVSGLVLGAQLALVSGGMGLLTDIGLAAFADRRGHRRVTIGGFVLMVIAAAGFVVARSSTLLWVGCFLSGLGFSAVGNPLLALVSFESKAWGAARLQGINGSVQRFGSLIGAGVVGLSLSLHHVAGMAAGVLAAACLGAGSLRSRAKPAASAYDPSIALGTVLRRGYSMGIRMLRRPAILLATCANIGLNLVFLETNAFIPLLRRFGASPAIVSGSLAARDIAAIALGLLIARVGFYAATTRTLVASLLLSGVSAAAMSLCAEARVMLPVVFLSGIQGANLAVGIAATNLYAMRATGDAERATGMAASLVIPRATLIVVPLVSGVALGAWGIRTVLYILGAAFIVVAIAVVAVGIGMRSDQAGVA